MLIGRMSMTDVPLVLHPRGEPDEPASRVNVQVACAVPIVQKPVRALPPWCTIYMGHDRTGTGKLHWGNSMTLLDAWSERSQDTDCGVLISQNGVRTPVVRDIGVGRGPGW